MSHDEPSDELPPYARLIRAALDGRALTTADALLWMVVLCTQRVVLAPGALGDAAGGGVLYPHTWRSAAETIALLWRLKKKGAEHRYAEYDTLYFDYCAQLSANSIDDVPEDRRGRVLELRALLRAHPWVQSVEDED